MIVRYSLIQMWSPIRTALTELSFSTIKQTVGHPSIDMSRLGQYVSTSGKGGSSKDTLVSDIDRQYGNMEDEDKELFLRHVIEQISQRNPSLIDNLKEQLNKQGWDILNSALVPQEIIGFLDLEFTPDSSHGDLVKAAARIRDGDLTGAITSASGAVNTACNQWGSSNKDSFQQEVNVALRESSRLDGLKSELLGLDWEENKCEELIGNLKGAISHGAKVMETLRSRMGDTHGSKEVLKPLVFDSIKWATIICSLLKRQ